MPARTFISVFVVSWFCAAGALAQERAEPDTVTTAAIGLRGGFDPNPTDTSGGRGSPFLTQTLAFDYLRGTDDEGIGVKITASDTVYDPQAASPTTNFSGTFAAARHVAPDLILRTSLTTTLDDTWSRRSHAALWHNRVEYDTPQFRLFSNFDVTLTALNERNIFAAGGFLPSDENFLNTTVLSGAAYKIGGSEVGVSASASRVSYLESSDYLGLDRSHDRLQPNVFFSTKWQGLDLDGSLSPFFAQFDTDDFAPVRQWLYTATAKYPSGPWTFGVAAARTVEDTTLPFSAIDLTSAFDVSASYKIDAANAVSFDAREKRDNYLGLGASSATRSLEADVAHDFGNGLVGTVGASLRQVKQTGLTLPASLNVEIGAQKKLDFSGPAKAANSPTSGQTK